MLQMGSETALETTSYNPFDEGLVTIDLRLLESLADFDNPSDPDYQLFREVHILATKVKERNTQLQTKRIESGKGI